MSAATFGDVSVSDGVAVVAVTLPAGSPTWGAGRALAVRAAVASGAMPAARASRATIMLDRDGADGVRFLVSWPLA